MDPPCWDRADEAALLALQGGFVMVPWQINLLRSVLDGSATTTLIEHRRRAERVDQLFRDVAPDVPPLTIEPWRPPTGD